MGLWANPSLLFFDESSLLSMLKLWKTRAACVAYVSIVAITDQSRQAHAQRQTGGGKDVHAEFCIVGSEGVAGKHALKKLLEKAPASSIVCIDSDTKLGLGAEQNVQVLRRKCTALHADERRITLDDGTHVFFQECLIATGKPLSSLMLAKESIRTRLGNLQGCFDKALLTFESDKQQILFIADTGGPHSEKEATLAQLHTHMSSGKHLTVIGTASTSWSVVETVLSLAATATNAGYSHSITLVVSSSGVLSYLLPRYFTTALNKRLRSMGVEVVPYAQLRYATVSEKEETTADSVVSTDSATSTSGVCTVYCQHTFDPLQTAMFNTDAVLLLNVDTGSYEEHFAVPSSSHRISGIDSDKSLERGTSGGIVANRSLQAAAGIYIAGDVANVDINASNGVIGRGCWEGEDHAEQSAEVAIYNMLNDRGYIPQQSRGQSPSYKSYNHIPKYGGADISAAVYVDFLGQCSAALDTHAFFWRVEGKDKGKDQDVGDMKVNSNEKNVNKMMTKVPSSDSDLSSTCSLPSAIGSEDGTVDPFATIDAISSTVRNSLLSYFGANETADRQMSATSSRMNGMPPLVVKGKAGITCHLSKKTEPVDVNNVIMKRNVPIGLGVIFYTNEEGVIAGVGITGLPNSEQISQDVHQRARACIGLQLKAFESNHMNRAANSYVNVSTSTTHILQTSIMEGLSKGIIAPAVGLSNDPNYVVSIPKPVYRRSAASAALLREAKAILVNKLSIPTAAVTRERVITSGANSSVRDKVSTAYSRNISGHGGGTR